MKPCRSIKVTQVKTYNIATLPVSLRPIVNENELISADVDGSSLTPAPRVEILDLYGNVVWSDPLSAV